MAKETIVRLRDDITGETVEEGHGESIRFSVNDVEYEIDLSDKNAADFHKALAKYIEHAAEVEAEPAAPARVSRPRTSSAATKSTKADKEQLAAMREWLRANGHQVSDRGRIAQNLQDIYNEDHK